MSLTGSDQPGFFYCASIRVEEGDGSKTFEKQTKIPQDKELLGEADTSSSEKSG